MSSHTEAHDSGNRTGEEAVDLVLDIENLRVSYGKVEALKGVDLQVREGELIAVIGPNGAGKSTLADTISGFHSYDGTVQYRGTDVSSVSKTSLVKTGLIHCTETRDLFGYMSAEDNLTLGTYQRGDVKEQLDFVYDLFPTLQERADQRARTMSGGEQQMLAIGRALMGDPDLLLLDEPTLGLAPVILEDISEGIEQIRESGVTIVLLEQNVTFALDHADEIHLLENGEIARRGTPAEMEQDNYIRDSYLGG